MRFSSVFLLPFLCCSTWEQGTFASSCGDLRNISQPFYLKGDTAANLDPYFELTCEGNQAFTSPFFSLGMYRVKSIGYENFTIHLVDPGLKSDNCTSLPHNRLSKETPTFLHFNGYHLAGANFLRDFYRYDWQGVSVVVIVKCLSMVTDPSYVGTSPCLNSSYGSYLYVVVVQYHFRNLHDNCSVLASTLAPIEGGDVNLTYVEIHKRMIMGFELFYLLYRGESCERLFESPQCFFKAAWEEIEVFLSKSLPIVARILIARSSFGVFCLSLIVIYKLLRRHLSMDDSIEEFLCQYKNNIPKRYSYWQILKMTNNFKEKLGKGGFGSVFKGKLPNGHLVAVKMLSKRNGKDFINEVATIGRIHHANVVQLIGFCSMGTKRALIYQYMSNGSLDKYIFSRENGHSLSWDQLYQIALGIAHGIEYLHRGCNMKILHFDIKPHNILLDENFAPKISDFGLAKFYSTEESVVSVTAVRGTIGYIAPELFYKRATGVTSKSDVYSFGMLLMEMAGRRKNVNPVANSSQIYFPFWIYDKLLHEEEVGIILDATEEEIQIAKKLLIVGLWCIQRKPIDRPSMTKAVEMLEGSVHLLQMPPKPFLSSPERAPLDDCSISMPFLSSPERAPLDDCGISIESSSSSVIHRLNSDS